MRLTKSKGDYRRAIVEKYRVAGEPWPARSIAIARWALKNKLIELPRRDVERLIARDLAQAMREEFYTDPQGRRVRRKHVYPEQVEQADGSFEQFLLWVDILDAETDQMHGADQMQGAFQYRRHQILGDCRQLKTDVDSFNDNNVYDASIQMVFNFANDLAEFEESAEFVA